MTLPRYRGYCVKKGVVGRRAGPTGVAYDAVCQALRIGLANLSPNYAANEKQKGVRSSKTAPPDGTERALDAKVVEFQAEATRAAQGQSQLLRHVSRATDTFKAALSLLIRRNEALRKTVLQSTPPHLHPSQEAVESLREADVHMRQARIGLKREYCSLLREVLALAVSGGRPEAGQEELAVLHAVRRNVVIKRKRKNLPAAAKSVLRSW